MNTIQKDQGKKLKDPHGLIKISLLVVGFIVLMILLKYLMDVLK